MAGIADDYDSDTSIVSEDDTSLDINSASSDGETGTDGRVTPVIIRALRRSLKNFPFGTDEQDATESDEKNDTASSGSAHEKDDSDPDVRGDDHDDAEDEPSNKTDEKRERQSSKSKMLPSLKNKPEKITLFEEGSLEINPDFLQPTTSREGHPLGAVAKRTVRRELNLTTARLRELHLCVLERPAEDELADDPPGLKVKLMAFQKYALTWLLWRESQTLAGGVLADAMGLGKTLTIISLVIAAKKAGHGGKSTHCTQRILGGTLVVAPASVIGQWQKEVNDCCKPGLLKVELYHGIEREKNAKLLARNDIVITTYNILARAPKLSDPLFTIHWERAVLDEAHLIRNHRSRTCEAACGISASNRWVLTGTPLHNREMDLFSMMKFLKCSPFDNVRVWKRWVDNNNVAGSERLIEVIKSIMLRRTEEELQGKGQKDPLPDKAVEIIKIKLDPDERVIYEKAFAFSRNLCKVFFDQRAKNAHKTELQIKNDGQPPCQTSQALEELSTHTDVASHQIFVSILRLRQLCCHPSLINSILDGADIEALLDQGQLDRRSNGDETRDEVKFFKQLAICGSPVFDPKRQSSKMKAILEKIEEIVEKRHEKVVVVSEWTSVLDIIANGCQKMKNITYRMFVGKVPVHDRQAILDDFNSADSKTNVLLLVLMAGGVGINLVGANHLIFTEMHWNPQLESQAEHCIHRYGQKKNVWIYKYICSDTVEVMINALQNSKLKMANNLLGASEKADASRLSPEGMQYLLDV